MCFGGKFGVFSQMGIFSQETLNAKLKMVQVRTMKWFHLGFLDPHCQ